MAHTYMKEEAALARRQAGKSTLLVTVTCVTVTCNLHIIDTVVHSKSYEGYFQSVDFQTKIRVSGSEYGSARVEELRIARVWKR